MSLKRTGSSEAQRKDDITSLLMAWGAGDDKAIAPLMRVVYAELRKVARDVSRRRRQGDTLQTTALVHEAYIRLASAKIPWQNRAHFFRVAALAIRQLLVNHAKKKKSGKRGGPELNITLGELGSSTDGQGQLPPREVGESPHETQIEILALNDALSELETIDPRAVQIVQLRYFAGLTLEEIAQVLGISLATVKNAWSNSRSWLYRRLTDQ